MSISPTGSTLRTLILGGGYCGLAAAVELGRHGIPLLLVEKRTELGGLSRTFAVDGAKFELGPHIYFDKDPEVVAFWRELVGPALRSYERNSRLYYDGRYIRSPLSIVDTLAKLGPLTVARILGSFVAAKLKRHSIGNAEDWVTANFGRELFERFFKVYNEKIWGLPSRDIAPDWAGQRVKSSLLSMIMRSIARDPSFIVKTFDFPDGGSETILAAQEARIDGTPTSEVRLGDTARRIEANGSRYDVTFESGRTESFSHVISTLHLGDLVSALDYPGKNATRLQQLLDQLIYRNLALVALAFRPAELSDMKEHWIDIHDPAIAALRVTNFASYALDSAPDRVAVTVEYNCNPDDPLWLAEDPQVAAQAIVDLRAMGLTDASPLGSRVIRIDRAYPVYFNGYRTILSSIATELSGAGSGLQLAGRNAMYKWNNMHHSVKTGILAARNVMGENHDLTKVAGNVTIGKDSD